MEIVVTRDRLECIANEVERILQNQQYTHFKFELIEGRVVITPIASSVSIKL